MNISTILWIGLGIFFIVLIIKENREVASFKKELEEDSSQKNGLKK
jgi:hypothetical protein